MCGKLKYIKKNELQIQQEQAIKHMPDGREDRIVESIELPKGKTVATDSSGNNVTVDETAFFNRWVPLLPSGAMASPVLDGDLLEQIPPPENRDGALAQIGRVLSSRISRDILALLQEKESMPLSQIAKAIGVNLHTAKYHLQPLLATDLIEIDNTVNDSTKKSVKKREMKWYRLKQKIILIAFCQKREMNVPQKIFFQRIM